MKPIRILMIDDHPSQIEGYKVILSCHHSDFKIESTACYTCESAYKIITSNQSRIAYDMVFLDKSMPGYPEKNIKSGEDLASLIKKHLPTSKIVIITSYAEAFLLYNIIKKIEPAGLLVKSDFKSEELIVAFDNIMDGKTYYTQTVKECISQLLANKNYLDSSNRQIIILLSKGVKTKNLPKHLHISLSAVEKRKAQIKDYLCIAKGNDEDIVAEAKKLGFI